MRKLAVLSFAAALMATSMLSYAATSPEGAIEVKKHVEEAIAFPLSLAKGYGQGLTLTGAIEVTAKGDYYEVKLPGAHVLTGGGLNFDIGTVIANVTPTEDSTGKAMKVAIAIPNTIRAMDDANAPIAEVKITNQTFNGTWYPELAAFTQLDAKYDGLTFNNMQGGSVTGSVDTVSAFVNLTKGDGDTWSGPYGLTGSGVKISISSLITADVAIEQFRAASSYENINLKKRKEMQDGFSSDLQKDAAQQPTPEQMGEIAKKALGSLSGFLDGMASNLELTNLKVSSKPDPANPETAGLALNAGIEKASMAFDMHGMLQEKGNTSLKVKIEGLKTGETDPTVVSLIPSHANVEIYLDNLPMQTLGKTLSEALGGLMGMFTGMGLGKVDPAKQEQIEQQAQMQMLSLMATVPQALTTAGTQLAIRNTFTDAPEFDANVEGAFKASATSPMMADGKLTISLKGLDELILKLQSLSQGPNANQRLSGYATMLSMLQVYTKPEQATDGKSLRKLVFELAPDGKILLNGQAVQAMPLPQ